MARPKKGIIDYIARDIEDVFQNAAKQTMIDLNNQLEQSYEQAIWAFYNDYPNPRFYKRTESTFYASNLYDIEARYNPEIKDNTIIGGLDLNNPAENMTQNGNPYGSHPYRADTDWVFYRTYIKGVHGSDKNERRHWGANKRWDNYLRKIRPKNRWNKNLLVNQYRAFRYIAYFYPAETEKQRKRSELQRAIGTYISMKYNYAMKGKKPIDMVNYAYYKIGSARNVKQYLDRHLLDYMIHNRYSL